MSEADMQKVAVVTGSSSGIGYATSLLLARKGFYTYASARNINKSASLQSIVDAERLPLKLIQLDVTDDSSVKDAVEKVVLEKGRIDVLVNNAGYGLFGAFEDLSQQTIFLFKHFNSTIGLVMNQTQPFSYMLEYELIMLK
jgi:NAD(P)-dependent dehydrogenase (short-subunit alcohol dehydrogenase family)